MTRANEPSAPLVWIEHWPEESTDAGEEAFEPVVSSNYEFTERAPPWGDEDLDLDLDRMCVLMEVDRTAFWLGLVVQVKFGSFGGEFFVYVFRAPSGNGT